MQDKNTTSQKSPIFFPVLFFLVQLLIIFFAGGDGLAAPETLWVLSSETDIKSAPKATGDVVATLSKGEELRVEEYENRWYKIRFTKEGQEKTGWIYRGKVTDTPPEPEEEKGETDDPGDLLSDFTGSEITAETAESSRSMRGIYREAAEYAQKTGKPETCRKALEYVLKQDPKPADVDAFLQAGGIGEYANE